MTTEAPVLLLVFALIAIVLGLGLAAAWLTALDRTDGRTAERDETKEKLQKAEKALRATEDRLAAVSARERQAWSLLADTQRRERAALLRLANTQNQHRPFPDVAAMAGSLVDEVEAWLANTPPTSEDY